MIRNLVLLALFLLPASASAYDGPISPPTLKEGQFVYTIPPGYTPKGMSSRQITRLNAELANLHNPFYVVVMKDLPRLNRAQRVYARSNGFRGDDETLRVEVSTSMLMEDWAGGDSGSLYDTRNSGVFIIAFSPRKYAWHPSMVAKNDLRMGKRAQDPYTQQFVRAAKTRPADYSRGIANLARKYDAFVFDRTDPARIAARAEQARLRAEARRLQAAQGALDTEILHLSQLLSEADHLPADVSSYQETLAKAKGVRKVNDPAKMLAEAESMGATVAVLDEHVSASISKARMAMLRFVAKWAFIFGLIGFCILMIVRRRRKQGELKAGFMRVYDHLNSAVTNAHGKYVDHYMERDDLVGLDGVTGETKGLWDKTTEQVDGILVRIRSLQKHAADCLATFKRGNFLNFAPYRQAVSDLSSSFEFDTGLINGADLFGGETVTLTVNPADFQSKTSQMFRDSIEGWKRLKEAAKERYGDAKDDFPHDKMDWLFEQADEHGIPTQWFEDHPLFGDDDSDDAFYAALDAIREDDPLAYVGAIEKARIDESAFILCVKRLTKAIEQARAAAHIGPFDAQGTKVSPEDDPAVTIAEARQAGDKLAGMLATGQNDVDGIKLIEIETQVRTIKALYSKTTRQGAEIKSAISGAKAAIEAAQAKGTKASADEASAHAGVAETGKIHHRIKPAQDDLASCLQYIDKGAVVVQQARNALREKRHLDARRLADGATSAYQSACEQAAAAVKHCDALDNERAVFESKRSQMGSTRDGFARKMRGYGSHSSTLAHVITLEFSGVADYASLSSGLDRQVSIWRTVTRKSERAYDAEQAEIRRRAAEAARQARAAAAAARRARSSYNSSSSSSGYGGGGFGGSSGGFGGGGFGGSSGSF